MIGGTDTTQASPHTAGDTTTPGIIRGTTLGTVGAMAGLTITVHGTGITQATTGVDGMLLITMCTMVVVTQAVHTLAVALPLETSVALAARRQPSRASAHVARSAIPAAAPREAPSTVLVAQRTTEWPPLATTVNRGRTATPPARLARRTAQAHSVAHVAAASAAVAPAVAVSVVVAHMEVDVKATV